MTDLTTLLEDTKRDLVIADLAQLVEDSVSQQSGISGMAVKGGLAAAQKVRPDVVKQGVARLLPDLLGDLDPYWKSYQANPGTDFGAHLTPHAAEIADSLLSSADGRVDEMNSQAIEKIYSSLRGRGAKLMIPHIPELGRVIEKHMK